MIVLSIVIKLAMRGITLRGRSDEFGCMPTHG